MPERAEIEAVDRSKQPGAILRDAETAIRLHAREDKGRFGEDGLDLDTAVKIIGILRDELVAALGRVRDARGEGGLCPECQLPARDGEHQLGCSRDARGNDEAARWIEPHDALKYELGDPMDDERVARSPQGEDHDQPFSGQAADDIVESQSEDHEAGIEAAAQALIRLHSVFEPSDNNFAWVVARHAVRAYVSRVSPSRDGTVADEAREPSYEAAMAEWQRNAEGWERCRAELEVARSPQGEDHEAGIEMAHRLVAAYEDRIARLKTAVRVGMPADIAIGADVKLSIAMDKDRDAISRMLPKGGLGQ